MKLNADHIQTTHTGSLPRPDCVLSDLLDREEGKAVDPAGFEANVTQAINEVVGRQKDIGLDLINDGEAGKPSYVVYVKYRLTGFEGEEIPRADPKWASDFPEFYKRGREGGRTITRPACNGPIEMKDKDGVHRDIANLRAAADAKGIAPNDVFMTAPSPGVITHYHANQHYESHEAYLYAVAEAMKHEYDAIGRSGFMLQIDCPDLPSASEREMHMDAINYALRDIPPERMRLHTCWGNGEYPHHTDVELKEIIDLLLTARPSGLSLEGANPRHEHEWKVFEYTKLLPEGKFLIPGMIDSTTNFIEHPELVAQRIVRYAQVVGKERVIAGTDCGLATNIAEVPLVDPRVAWAKLQSLTEGAQLASKELWSS